jgi:hypothetical protein
MIDLDNIQHLSVYEKEIRDIDKLLEDLRIKIESEYENVGSQTKIWSLKAEEEKLYKKVCLADFQCYLLN